MAFTPNTKLYLGSVPFDQSYTHVVYIPDRDEQRAQIAARCTFGVNREDYTYQRPNNTVKVPYNAEQLYGLNYCMFQNSNYGNRWFYAFITNIEYVSEDTSRLWLQDDVFQTWFPDAQVQTSYVEREHVNDDTIGAHIKDEGLSPGELKCQWSDSVHEKAMYIVAASAAEPLKSGGYVNVAGDTYCHMPSGCSLSAFGNTEDFGEWMRALADNGQQDAVSNVYMVPSRLISPDGLHTKDDGWGYWVNADRDAEAATKTFNLGFTTLNGYTPKNNKMYCYPFEYCELTNYMGQSQQFRLEFMDNATLSLKLTGGVDSNAHLVYVPLNYNGIPEFWEGAVNLGAFPTCQWVYQTYANWAGQGNVTLGIPGVAEVQTNARTQLPYYQAVGSAAVNNLGVVESLAQNLIGLAGGGKMSAARETARGNSIAQAGLGAGGGLLSNAANMVGDMIQIQADLGQQQRSPNTSRGSTNSSVNQVSVRNYGIAVRKYTCRAEFARMCDNYLSAYGYNVSEFKQPNLTGRNSWNYVKTIGMQLHGKIPNDAMQSLQNMFNRGITLWHTWDVGNYALDNSIV